MKIFIGFAVFVSFSECVYSCKTAFQKCKEDSDCCVNYHCHDVGDKGNGHCVLNTCEPVRSKKLIVQCFTSSNRTASCDQFLQTDSRATFRCNTPIYWQIKKPEYTEITCRNGRWDRPLVDDFCEVDCGRSIMAPSRPDVSGEQKSELGEFPWHVGIYELDPVVGEYEQKCGGTLISLKVVVSAAHCFTHIDSKTKKVEINEKLWTFKVAAGKFYRNINATEKFAQIKDVARIEIPKEYKGVSSYFESDIAFVILKEEVEYSRAVLPICIDVGEDHFEENPLMQGTMGKVAGWDLKPQKMYDEKSMVTKMPFIPKEKCLKKLGYEWFYYVNHQKLCAGDEKSRYNVCGGNGGAGLVFAEPTTQKYYLRAVVSLGPKCDWDDGVAVFTTLSSYKKLVKKYSSDNCEALISKKLEIECFTPSNRPTTCSKPLETNSRARFRCKTPIYTKIREPEYTEIACMNRQWDRPLVDDFCAPECGRPGANVTFSRSRRRISEIAELPWHAGIYELQFLTKEWEQICGGTLISPKVVTTAASCFDRHKRKADAINVSIFKVAVGKFYRNINANEDTLAQIKEVASVHISPDYDRKLYKGDIAFVILKEAVEYSRAVLPICTDGENSFGNGQLANGAIGKVAGWGLASQGIPSERLMLTEMQFIPRDKCKKDDGVWSPYVSEEKLCAKGRKSRYNVCNTYSGGGLVFSQPAKEKYYLRGVLSLGPCDETDEVVLFTAFCSYKDLVERYSEGKCEPLNSEKLEIMCFAPSKEMIPCNKTMEKNSRASFRCKRPIYWEIREPEYNEVMCKNGQWDRPLIDDFCEPDCGRFISKWEQRTLGDKNKIENIEFPWHAWIFEFDPLIGAYEQRCGGTLISPKVVITAAHCFIKENSQDLKIELKKLATFKIVVGKYFRNINSSEDTFAQIKEIAHVEIPREYQEEKSPYVGDIAVIVLKEKVEYSWAVQPICIDIGKENFESEQLVTGAKGKFAGLRIHREQVPSKSLQWMKTPFIPTEDCKKRIGKEWQYLVKEDIFCVGNENLKSGVCDGDIGGGLVFLEPTQKKYYLRGVASLSPPCSEKNFGLFTKLSSYNDFIGRHATGIATYTPENNRPTRMNNCLRADQTGCHKIDCCSNLKCSDGPNGIWDQGLCIEKSIANIPLTFPESSELDDGVDNDYKDYYRNYCEPVVSEKLKVLCFTPSNERTSCDKNFPINSSATFHCNRPLYSEVRKPEYASITCRNGQWDRPLLDDFCEVGCGRPLTNVAQPAIKNGKSAEFGEFPWHAGIYDLNNVTETFEQKCGGTLISPTVVISAAHCVASYVITERKIMIKDLSTMKVAVGKFYRNINSSEDDASAQIREIASIEVSERYHESYSLYDGDIAFIVLKERVEYSRVVLPICLDVGKDSFEKKQLVKGTTGLVAGWGITSHQKGSSEKLKFAELPFVPMDECERKIGEQWLAYLNKDKLCIGMEFAEMNICGGDSGGGLIFEESESRRFYLRGIVSLGPRCYLQDGFALFTDLAMYKELVKKYLQVK